MFSPLPLLPPRLSFLLASFSSLPFLLSFLYLSYFCRPGAPCTQDSQCYFSTDGVTATASTCSNGVCAGIKLGDACVGSYQCLVGSFCSSATGTCTALGNLGQSCSSDNQCDSRWVCRNSQCSTMYTQNEGQACTQNEDCSDNLYCKSGVCAKGTNAGNTHTPCDIQSNNCGADQYLL